jgi:hypothetical protein
MATEKTVSIFVPANGRKNYVAHDVPVSKLANYSQIAKWLYFPAQDAKKPYGEGDKRSISTKEYDLGENIDEEFARTVAIHIKNSDTTNPAPLTIELFGKDRTVQELTQIWRVIGLGYKCPIEGHDDTIRGDLRYRMYETTPFTFLDFKLIADNLYFDRGMFHSAMDRVAFLHIKGYLSEETKMAVENYCQEKQGWWDSLLDNVGRVEMKINEAAAQKDVREKRKEQQKAGKGRRVREGAADKSPKDGGKGKKISGKEKEKKPAAPFVRNDDDFPPLS